MSDETWRERALAEIAAIKPAWEKRYRWAPDVREGDGLIDLFVRFSSRGASPNEEEKQFVVRLRYESDFETAGRREVFVNPENYEEEGIEYWPQGVQGINPGNNPPAICLEGTWGFHSVLHRDRDGRSANLNRLLIEIQRCLNP